MPSGHIHILWIFSAVCFLQKEVVWGKVNFCSLALVSVFEKPIQDDAVFQAREVLSQVK